MPDTLSFDEIAPLFGLPIDAPEAALFLERHGDHKIGKPSDGDQYVVFKSLGFDMLFRQPPVAGRRTGPKSRLLRTVTLYREGQDGHAAFADPPFGIAFADTRAELLAKLGEPYRRSDLDAQGNPAWEKWRIEDWTLHAMYERASMTTKVFSLGRACDASDLP